jgi:hypothetical protein
MNSGPNPIDEPKIDVRDLLNTQTGRISWTELQRHFAAGVVLIVAGDLDLIDVAARIIEDNRGQVEGWLEAGRLTRAETAHARAWEAAQAEFWAVVAAPWVLVQEIREPALPKRQDHSP